LVVRIERWNFREHMMMIQGQMCVSIAQSCLKRSVVLSDDIVEPTPARRKTARSCSKSLLNLDCYKEKSI
jgi:hypothetical protein